MLRNGQAKALDLLIGKRYDPSQAVAQQAAYNGQRQARIQKALQTRPVYIPLQFDLPAAGQTSPVRASTPNLGYDVIITGIRSDVAVDETTNGTGGVVAGGNRDILIERTDVTKPLLATDTDSSLYLRTDEISGKTAAVDGGVTGIFSLPSPIVLGASDRLTVSMFKQDTTGTDEIANIVLIGVAVYGKGYTGSMLDDVEQQKISQAVSLREVPAVRLLKHQFSFDTAAFGGAARNLRTPVNIDEPLLVRGLRSNLSNSLITLGLAGQPMWTVQPTPIWALAAEDEMTEDNYIWFPRPVYLRAGGTIEIPTITNGTGTAAVPGPLDPQNNNTLTWICETL